VRSANRSAVEGDRAASGITEIMNFTGEPASANGRKSTQPMAKRLEFGEYNQLHHFIAAGV